MSATNEGAAWPAGVEERGPEAAATLARLRDLHEVVAGEGYRSCGGTDGPTSCLVHESMWPEDEGASEDELRRCTRVQRFATEAEARDASARLGVPNARAWPGRPVEQRTPRGAFHFSWSYPMAGCGVTLDGWVRDGQPGVRLVETDEGREVRRHTRRLTRSAWARFQHELLLLAVHGWSEYRSNATDGSQWRLQYSDGGPGCVSGGINAYPPDGTSFSPTAPFARLLLAFERLLERALWDDVPRRLALDDIPDARDRVEQSMLGALRSWGWTTESDGVDPGSLNEVAFEKSWLPHLTELVDARRQVTVHDALPTWPGVGGLDVSIDDPKHPAWIELKWAKSADTFHNCLWDAAKVALAVRQGHARGGYLIAGAPLAEWQKRTRPARLFTANSYLNDALVSDYPTWWTAWAKQQNYPQALPTPLLTTPVGAVDVDHPAGAWRIAISRVAAPGNAVYDPRLRDVQGGPVDGTR